MDPHLSPVGGCRRTTILPPQRWPYLGPLKGAGTLNESPNSLRWRSHPADTWNSNTSDRTRTDWSPFAKKSVSPLTRNPAQVNLPRSPMQKPPGKVAAPTCHREMSRSPAWTALGCPLAPPRGPEKSCRADQTEEKLVPTLLESNQGMHRQ